MLHLYAFVFVLSVNFISLFADQNAAHLNQIRTNSVLKRVLKDKLIDVKHPPPHIDTENLEISTNVVDSESTNLTFSLILRTIYLFIIFMPILLTSGLFYDQVF